MTLAADRPPAARLSATLSRTGRRAAQPGPAAASVGTSRAPRPTPAPAAAPKTGAATWSQVDVGFYVASRVGEFVGSVEATNDGSFIAFDGTNTPIGRFASLEQAESAVADWRPERDRVRDRRLAVRMRPLASSAAIIAASVAAMGAVLTLLPG